MFKLSILFFCNFIFHICFASFTKNSCVDVISHNDDLYAHILSRQTAYKLNRSTLSQEEIRKISYSYDSIEKMLNEIALMIKSIDFKSRVFINSASYDELLKINNELDSVLDSFLISRDSEISFVRSGRYNKHHKFVQARKKPRYKYLGRGNNFDNDILLEYEFILFYKGADYNYSTHFVQVIDLQFETESDPDYIISASIDIDKFKLILLTKFLSISVWYEEFSHALQHMKYYLSGDSLLAKDISEKAINLYLASIDYKQNYSTMLPGKLNTLYLKLDEIDAYAYLLKQLGCENVPRSVRLYHKERQYVLDDKMFENCY